MISTVVHGAKVRRARRIWSLLDAVLRSCVLLLILLLGCLLPASAHADAGEGEPDCRPDDALAHAAAELLLQGGPPSTQALTAALRAADSDLVGARGVYWPASASIPRGWLETQQQKADAQIVCGYAQSDSGRLLLAAARAGSLELLSADSHLVHGSIAPDFSDPQLVVEDANGVLFRIAASRAQLASGIAISAELARPARIQLLARGPAGPRPVAERVLPAPGGSVSDAPVVDQPREAQRALSARERLAALRRERGRTALRDNRALAEVAMRHAEHVCSEGRIAHELTPGADPTQRLRALGISARRVGETVARGASASEAFASFEHSPSHLLTLLEPDFTDVGIGEVSDAEGRRCVVVLLAAWPRYLGR